jgi:PIN domain nuclease of toxin-antitoxin system
MNIKTISSASSENSVLVLLERSRNDRNTETLQNETNRKTSFIQLEDFPRDTARRIGAYRKNSVHPGKSIVNRTRRVLMSLDNARYRKELIKASAPPVARLSAKGRYRIF